MRTSLRATHSVLILRSRALARRLEGWPKALVADPSRRGQEAAPQDEGSVGLAKTAGRCVHALGRSPGRRKYFRSSTLNFWIRYPRPQNLAYPARVLSSEGRFMR